jgi:hypothetical protein
MKKTTADSWPWQSYPGENFDRITALALFIADCERANGRAEPPYGYSRGDWLRAEETIKNPVR